MGNVLAELATCRCDVERENATPVSVPHVQYIVTDLQDISCFLSAG